MGPGQLDEPQLGLVALLNVVGVAQALLFACALVGARRGTSRANRILAALLVVIAVILLSNVLFHTRYLLRSPHLAQWHVPLELLIAPLVWFYVRALVHSDRQFAIRDVVHVVPALACAGYLIPFYLQSAAAKESYLRAALETYPIEWRVRTGIILAIAGPYLAALGSLPGVVPRQRERGTVEPDPELAWARVCAAAFAVIFVVGAIRFLISYDVRSNLLVPLLFSILVNAAVYVRLRGAPLRLPVPDAAAQKKYERSTLTPDRADRYLARLLAMMETERCYTDGKLTLPRLADRLSISPHHLSQLLNERRGKNFSDFINAYRVDDAKRQLVDPRQRQFSILAIAESAGFTSKSAFNAAFKKLVGMTPSEWRRQHESSTER